MAAYGSATVKQPPVTYNNAGGIGLADPASEAAKRAQSRLSAGTLAAQQGLATRLQGYDQSRTRANDDAEWALRTGAEANMRHLTGVNAVNSGLRDRFAERLQGQVGRPLTRGLEDISAQENLAKGQTAESIAQLQANLPVMQAEEMQRQQTMDSQGIANAMNVSTVTGRYMPPGSQALINQILNAKAAWEQAQGGGDQAGMAQAHQAADQARASLTAMGVSPNLFGADINRGNAERNVGQGGIITPTARQLAAALSGIDPVTGQATLAGKAANQALTLGDLQNQVAANPNYGLGAQAAAGMAGTNQALRTGDLNYSVASNPNYGLGAQAAAGMTTTRQAQDMAAVQYETAKDPRYGLGAQAMADIGYKNAYAAQRDYLANGGAAAGKAGAKIDRAYIAKQWGLAKTSPFTTDYGALNNYIEDWVNNSQDQTVTMDDVRQWAAEKRDIIRGDHVDPQDVLNALEALLKQGGGGGSGSAAWAAAPTSGGGR